MGTMALMLSWVVMTLLLLVAAFVAGLVLSAFLCEMVDRLKRWLRKRICGRQHLQNKE